MESGIDTFQIATEVGFDIKVTFVCIILVIKQSIDMRPNYQGPQLQCFLKVKAHLS